MTPEQDERLAKHRQFWGPQWVDDDYARQYYAVLFEAFGRMARHLGVSLSDLILMETLLLRNQGNATQEGYNAKVYPLVEEHLAIMKKAIRENEDTWQKEE